jgi:hypothetical protein
MGKGQGREEGVSDMHALFPKSIIRFPYSPVLTAQRLVRMEQSNPATKAILSVLNQLCL